MDGKTLIFQSPGQGSVCRFEKKSSAGCLRATEAMFRVSVNCRRTRSMIQARGCACLRYRKRFKSGSGRRPFAYGEEYARQRLNSDEIPQSCLQPQVSHVEFFSRPFPFLDGGGPEVNF